MKLEPERANANKILAVPITVRGTLREVTEHWLARDALMVPKSVQRWRLRLGLKRPNVPAPTWTAREDVELMRLFRAGLSDVQIAARMGRSAPFSVQGRRRIVGLIRLDERPWAAEDNQLMRELWDRGATTREIVAQLSRTRAAVTMRRRRMGPAPRA